jgi:hypothetical protein
VFLAEGLTAGEPEFGDTEDLEIRRLPLREALALIETGDITDAMSVAALLGLAARR